MAKKPSAAQLRARAAFAARYGGKRKKAKATGTPRMARFARTRRYASSARRVASRGRGRSGTSYKTVIDGALAAGAARAGAAVSPTYGPAAGMAAVGIYRRNEALATLGVMKLAGNVLDSFAIPMVPQLPQGVNL